MASELAEKRGKHNDGKSIVLVSSSCVLVPNLSVWSQKRALHRLRAMGVEGMYGNIEIVLRDKKERKKERKTIINIYRTIDTEIDR